MNSAKEWSDYYRQALETVQKDLAASLKEGENFTQRRAYVLGYIEGALKMVTVEVDREHK